jgi:hypothetical protein
MPPGIVLQLVYWLSLPTRGLAIGAMVWRKLVLEFPVFACYLMVSEAGDIARLVAYRTSSKAYFFTYWCTDSVVSAFALLAVYELLVRRLFPGFQRVRFYRRLFPIAAIPILGIGISAAFVILTGYQTAAIFVRIIHSFDGLRLASLVFLAALMLMMGRRWRGYDLGIALGLGLDAIGFLITASTFTKFKTIRPIALIASPIANDLACLVWLIACLRAQKSNLPAEEQAQMIEPQIVGEARKSEDAVKAWLESTRRPPDKQP